MIAQYQKEEEKEEEEEKKTGLPCSQRIVGAFSSPD